MNRWKRFWYQVRTKLIQFIAGKDISIMSNITISGVVYPRGKWVTCNFIMGNMDVRTDPGDLEEVHDQVNVDSNA